jgi:hypothetical protein
VIPETLEHIALECDAQGQQLIMELGTTTVVQEILPLALSELEFDSRLQHCRQI